MKFYIALPEPELARGGDASLSFNAHGADAFAEQLQHALADPTYIRSWQAGLDEEQAEGIDARLLAVDRTAIVRGEQRDLGIALVVDTSLNGEAFKHRMRLLAGTHWLLTDVK